MKVTIEHNSLTIFGINEDQQNLLIAALQHFSNSKFENKKKDLTPKEEKDYAKRKEAWLADRRETLRWIVAIEAEIIPDSEKQIEYTH